MVCVKHTVYTSRSLKSTFLRSSTQQVSLSQSPLMAAHSTPCASAAPWGTSYVQPRRQYTEVIVSLMS